MFSTPTLHPRHCVLCAYPTDKQTARLAETHLLSYRLCVRIKLPQLLTALLWHLTAPQGQGDLHPHFLGLPLRPTVPLPLLPPLPLSPPLACSGARIAR